MILQCTAPVRGHVSAAAVTKCPACGGGARAVSAVLPPASSASQPRGHQESSQVTFYSREGKREHEEWRDGDGELHREDGPAWVQYAADGTTMAYEEWHEYGKRHRDDGPALVWYAKDGTTVRREMWYRHGEWHREDGPAWIGHDNAGKPQVLHYYVNGNQRPGVHVARRNSQGVMEPTEWAGRDGRSLTRQEALESILVHELAKRGVNEENEGAHELLRHTLRIGGVDEHFEVFVEPNDDEVALALAVHPNTA